MLVCQVALPGFGPAGKCASVLLRHSLWLSGSLALCAKAGGLLTLGQCAGWHCLVSCLRSPRTSGGLLSVLEALASPDFGQAVLALSTVVALALGRVCLVCAKLVCRVALLGFGPEERSGLLLVHHALRL